MRESAMPKKKLLIIDDDEDICELLRLRFEIEGFEVHTAHNSHSFRNHVFTVNPDLVILDVMLGHEEGPEVYRKLLGEGMEKDLPVVFLTSLLDEGAQTPIRPGRTHGLYRKPVDVKSFVRDIKVCVGVGSEV
jgi:DNA-binding response OmpR family regulator